MGITLHIPGSKNIHKAPRKCVLIKKEDEMIYTISGACALQFNLRDTRILF